MSPIPPPFHNDFPDANPETLQKLSPEHQKEFQQSYAYKKYVLPTLERDKRLKKQQRNEWFWVKGALILNTIFAGISAICAIISLLK